MPYCASTSMAHSCCRMTFPQSCLFAVDAVSLPPRVRHLIDPGGLRSKLVVVGFRSSFFEESGSAFPSLTSNPTWYTNRPPRSLIYPDGVPSNMAQSHSLSCIPCLTALHGPQLPRTPKSSWKSSRLRAPFASGD